jgi:hypothetical protein
LATPDETTVVLTLEEPLNVFPKLLAMPVTAITPAPIAPGFSEHPVGSGPWKFVSWVHDDAIVLARNESYWGTRPAADSIRIRIIPEALTQAAEYEAGQLSVVEIPFGESRRWESQHGAEILKRPAIRDTYIAINTTRGPLRDVRVRRALNHAVDMPTILRPPLVYGPGVKANFLALMRAIDRGWPLPFASVVNQRSLIYVGNLVDAIVRGLERGVVHKTYALSDGAPVSTPELCRAIARALGRPARLFAFPRALLALVPRASRLVESQVVDDTAFRAELDWRPPFTLERGLRDTAEWYRARGG